MLQGRKIMQQIALQIFSKTHWKNWIINHLIGQGTISSQELGAELRVVGQLLVQIETFPLLLAETLKEKLANWHFMEVYVVRKQTLVILTRFLKVTRTNNHIALIVDLVASAIDESQALPETTVNWTNCVDLLHFVAGQK